MKLGISYMVFNGEELLPHVTKQIRHLVDYISVVYQPVSFFGEQAGPQLMETLEKAKSEGLVDELVKFENDLSLTSKPNEQAARNAGLDRAIAAGCTHHISADVDEFYIPEQLEFAKKEMESGWDCSVSGVTNYFKKPTWKIVPNEKHIMPLIYTVECRHDMKAQFPFVVERTKRLNKFDKVRVFKEDEFMIHHMTYIRKDIRSKVKNSSQKMLHDTDRFLVDFDKYQLGERLLLPPNFINRKTVLADDIFNLAEEFK